MKSVKFSPRGNGLLVSLSEEMVLPGKEEEREGCDVCVCLWGRGVEVAGGDDLM